MIERPKQGFSLPINKWLRGPLKDWAINLLEKKYLPDDGILNGSIARDVLDQHLKKKRNWGSRLWPILMWQQWHYSKGTLS